MVEISHSHFFFWPFNNNLVTSQQIIHRKLRMTKKNLHLPFEVLIEKLDVYPADEQVFSFFQLVYVVSGKGWQCINKNRTEYCTGTIFLITPDDCHTFDIKETTTFVFIRFNKSYLTDERLDREGKKRMELILDNANHLPGCILSYQPDKPLVRAIMEAIIENSVNKEMYNNELIIQLINALIIITARNVLRFLPDRILTTEDSKATNIIQYIQTNIYYPDKLRADVISCEFGISKTYLSKYFKKHTGENLQSFINEYRMKMIESRLCYSDMRISEIAFELGFTDESHLNKFFRQHKGVSPKSFRESLLK